MACLSLHRVRCKLSSCISRLFTPGRSRETVLFGGPDPNRGCTHESANGTTPMMPKEEPALPAASSPGVSAKDSGPIRLHTVRILFSHKGTQSMEDIKRKGLDDVVFDAIPLQELSAQAQDDYGNTKDIFLVDLAVVEAGISRVWGKYGIIKFVPLSSDDPIVLQQSAKDPDLRKALCYQHIHSRYLQEYEKRQLLAAVLGYEIHQGLSDWYDDCLEDISNRLRKLGYF